MAKVWVLPLWTKEKHGVVVSTVSKSKSGLSPFLLGPCALYDGWIARNMENAWQYSKIYKDYYNPLGKCPMMEYFKWAMHGWDNPRAIRYPMGKGRKPIGSWWNGKMLDYVSARKTIYGPLYAEAVQKTEDWRRLKRLYKIESEITLLDYDAYDHRKLGMSLTDVLNDPKHKMGHAFVLAMLLKNSKALNQMELRS